MVPSKKKKMGHRAFMHFSVAFFVTYTVHALQHKLLLHAAPMQAYTNRFLRYFYRLLSPDTQLWTEMEKLEDLLESQDACSRRLTFHPLEHPLVLQLGGNSPSQLREVIAVSRPYQYDEVNLNVGCPSIETGGANYGAALMTQPKLVVELLDIIRKETDPQTKVSIKCRIGVHDKLIDQATPPTDTYDTLHSFISTVTSTGSVDHVIVHARSAILGGTLLPSPTPLPSHLPYPRSSLHIPSPLSLSISTLVLPHHPSPLHHPFP